jgi:hypothetical protein
LGLGGKRVALLVHSIDLAVMQPKDWVKRRKLDTRHWVPAIN